MRLGTTGGAPLDAEEASGFGIEEFESADHRISGRLHPLRRKRRATTLASDQTGGPALRRRPNFEGEGGGKGKTCTASSWMHRRMPAPCQSMGGDGAPALQFGRSQARKHAPSTACGSTPDPTPHPRRTRLCRRSGDHAPSISRPPSRAGYAELFRASAPGPS